jgi:hypothetical protein
MGMGYVPCHAWTITLDGLRKLCPIEVETIEAAFEDKGFNWDSFALEMKQEIGKEEFNYLLGKWEQLQKVF